jgi:hypothetical protein
MKRIIILLAALAIASQGYAQKQKEKPDTAYRIMEATYIGLNVADYALTINGLKKGAKELNPVAKKLDPYAMAGLKLGSMAGVVVLGRIAYKENPKAAKITMVGMNIITGLVLTNNISVTISLNK